MPFPVGGGPVLSTECLRILGECLAAEVNGQGLTNEGRIVTLWDVKQTGSYRACWHVVTDGGSMIEVTWSNGCGYRGAPARCGTGGPSPTVMAGSQCSARVQFAIACRLRRSAQPPGEGCLNAPTVSPNG